MDPIASAHHEEPQHSTKNISEVSFVHHAAIFSGPLPPPSVLGEYNQLVPDAAERILTMAERQSAHREEIETAVVLADISSQTRGSWFSFILILVVIGVGFTLLEQGKDVQGLVAILGTLAGLVGSFIYSARAQKKEADQKDDVLESRRTR